MFTINTHPRGNFWAILFPQHVCYASHSAASVYTLSPLDFTVCEVASVISDFCDPVDGSPLGSSVHGIPFFKISVIIFYNVPTGSKWLTSLEIRNGHSVLLTGFTTLLNVKPVFANLWSDVQLDVNFLISHLCVEINLIFYFFSYNILTCAFFN